ncbi:MAG: T9SS type A sorting domain-containing protein, partial [Bacteroidia bacterium]|nr:T9SS type A sorting domain-containing protein [Bacteroidia bacterium]
TYAYGCGNTSLKKPFIVVPGINIPELIELNDGENPGTYQAFINDLNNFSNINGRKIKELLEREGYDLVYIEYHHGADWIQNNAKLLETIIRMVNQEKTANGSTEPNVVYGESMGGVVARYALCEMEANHEMHDVEQFISFDSPHNGANVPLGAQALLAHLNDIQFRVAFIPVLKLNSFVPQLRIAEEAMKNNGAVKQLLIDYYFHVPKIGSTNARDVLMSELDAFGFPKQTSVRGNTIRNIILSNGSGAGAAGELFPSHAKMMDFESSMGILTSSFTSFLVFGFTGTGFRAHAEIWSVPVNNATPLTVYHGGYNASVLGVLLNVINNRWFKVENANGLDHLPGGTMESMPITPPNNIGLLTVYQPNFCFIPTISSCALLPPYRNNTTYNINANYNEVTNTWSNGESSVHLVILGRNNVTNSPENQFHISWNTSNSDFLIQHAFTAPRLEQTILSNLEFNYGGNSSKVLSSISLVNYSAIKINGNQAIGLSSNNPPLPKPTVGSHFEVHTNGQNCNAGKVTVSVFNNSSVIIGDNSVGNTGVLTIQPGDIIELYNGGSLKIADNSKLVIEEGAELVIHQGANILLEGEDAQIEIHGKLRLQNGAVFNPQKGSAPQVGYVHFIRPSGFTGNQIVAEGNTSSIQLTGSGKSNLLLKVEGGELQIPHPASNPGNYVASLAVTDGLIVVSEGSSLKCGSDIAYDNVRTRGGGAGLVLCGQSNYSFLNTDFRELAIGIQVINVYSDRMEFSDILFKNNSYAGILSDQSSLILDNCSFYYNNQGVLIQSPAAESEITNSMFGFNATAVAQADNGLLYIEETIILNANSGTGISFNTEQDDGGALVLACTKLYSNAVGIEAGVNTEINLSTSIASGTAPYYYGGNNSFWVNGNSIRLNTALLYLEDGYNNFIGEPSTGGSPPYHFVTGTIPDNITANIDATYNYWYPSPPGSDIIYGGADYFSIGNYSGAPPPHLTTIKLHGDILANVNSQCYEDPENTIWYIPLSRTMPEDGNPKPQPQTAFILYPNPVNDILVIETAQDKLNPTGIDNPEKNTIKSVELYDVQGKKLAKGSLNSGHWEISTQELAEGIYIVRVMTGNSVYNQYVRVLR